MTTDDNDRLPVRRGLTLLEVLVVVAILGLLIAVALPAVQNAREASRQVTCMSQLRQLAIASELHVNRQGHFPSNGWGYQWGPDPAKGYGRNQPAGWIYQIAIDLDPAAADAFSHLVNTDQPHPYLAIVRCPTRSAPLLGPVSPRLAPFNYGRSELAPKTDYAINEGHIVTRTRGGPESDDPTVVAGYDWSLGQQATGISYQRSRVTLAMVSDGLSHTYLIGEKHVYRNAYSTADDRGYDQSCWSGVDLDLNRWTNHRPLPDAIHAVGRQFGSPHPVVWHVAFCDGSVRKLPFTIDGLVHAMNGNRADSGRIELRDPFSG